MKTVHVGWTSEFRTSIPTWVFSGSLSQLHRTNNYLGVLIVKCGRVVTGLIDAVIMSTMP